MALVTGHVARAQAYRIETGRKGEVSTTPAIKKPRDTSLTLFTVFVLHPGHGVSDTHHSCFVTTPGRFMIRPSDYFFLSPQSDLERKKKRRSKGHDRKGLARNAQIRGVFGSPP
jgi:hypothetical protein